MVNQIYPPEPSIYDFSYFLVWVVASFLDLCIPCTSQKHVLFLFCYEQDFITDLSNNSLVDIFKAFNPYFEGMVNQIYPPEFKLNTANTSDTEAPFWTYFTPFLTALFPPKRDKRDDVDFDIVNFPLQMAMFHNVLLTEYIFLSL